MGNLIYAVAFLVKNALTIYFYIVIASAILSWVNPDPYNPIVRFLRNATEPVYMRIRRHFPFLIVGGMDLTPIVVIVLIQFLQIALVGNLMDLAHSFRSPMNGMMYP
ncbi:MAG: YggT family protein [Thermodesulfobacteriota bacterium]